MQRTAEMGGDPRSSNSDVISLKVKSLSQWLRNIEN